MKDAKILSKISGAQLPFDTTATITKVMKNAPGKEMNQTPTPEHIYENLAGEMGLARIM